ncbi:phage tail sheath family protein [Ilyomonas limi]|uniref:Phage tail sheath family protein n=1 Tax=Ilyomonas limi TaxID=2575867 RepID=A0A4U3L442_9BACT|nr:phage tail sheath C-terminal domain-containing protein [Ilyomonas limi]TKK69888.1 phage tail sheath family protein [Ilyomonas limi]
MADVFKTPGVYIKEIPLFPPSIAEVETAIPAFIGYTETATINGLDLDLTPTRISSLLEYESIFGAAQKENAIVVTITDSLNGTALNQRTITADITPAKRSRFKMYYSLQMFFANGGGPCYIVSTGTYGNTPTTNTYADTDIDRGKLSAGLAEVAKFDEPTLLVFPDATSLSDSDYNALMGEALSQCADLQDRFAIMDVKPVTVINTIRDSMDSFRNAQLMESSIDKLKYGAAYFPFLETALIYRYDLGDVSIVYQTVSGTTTTTLTDPATASKNLKLADILTPPSGLDAGIRDGLNLKKNTPLTSPPSPPVLAGNTELYNLIKAELNKVTVELPPSGAVVGVYAAVDSSRGVWKAPANVSLAYVNAPSVKISHNDQMDLNVDATSGKSINAIRSFVGQGNKIWGARTLAGNDNEWRYISVRRFFNYAEESIKKGTEWVVFEPNDANTWIRVKAMIENFLTKQWRAGALAGEKPEQAFFVKVGLGLTMTALDILEGRMNVEIGMAVVRPAEFIILKFSHKLQES